MSKLFFDSLVDLTKVEKEIKKAVKDKESQIEMIHLIDEMVHHRVIGCILDRLPEYHHEEFASHISEKPHDESILHYLKTRIGQDVTGFIKEEVYLLSKELLEMVHEETTPKRKKGK